MKRNILFFFSSSQIGGAETTFIEIIKELSRNELRCFLIVCQNQGPLLDILHDYIYDSKEIRITSLNFIKTLREYYIFLNKNNIDTVFNFGLKVEIFSRLFSKTFGVASIVSNIRSVDDWRKWYHTRLDRLFQSHTDIWISNSEAGKLVFSKREKVPLNRISVIYNMSSKVDSKSSRQHIKKDIYTIGIVSNIKPGKGFEDILQICSKGLINKIEFTFLLAGKDTMGGRIHDQVSKLELNKSIKFLGFITNKQSFFNNIDLFFLPTYWEGMPSSIIEALKFGVPVISTNVGGIPEIISDTYNGLLYSPGDIIGMAGGIESLLIDHELYNRFIYNGQKVIEEKFNNEVLLSKWIEVIGSLPKRQNIG